MKKSSTKDTERAGALLALVYLMFIQAKNDRAKKVEKHNIIHRQPFFCHGGSVAILFFSSSLPLHGNMSGTGKLEGGVWTGGSYNPRYLAFRITAKLRSVKGPSASYKVL